MFVETWDVVSSEASREATSVSDDSSSWSQLDQLSAGINSCLYLNWSNNTNKDTQLSSVAEQQCFLSVVCYLFNIHLQSVFILWTESCLEDSGTISTGTMPLYYLFIISVCSYWYCDTRNDLLGWMFQGKCKWCNSYQTRCSGIISLTCDWMEMMINDVKGVKDRPSFSLWL